MTCLDYRLFQRSSQKGSPENLPRIRQSVESTRQILEKIKSGALVIQPDCNEYPHVVRTIRNTINQQVMHNNLTIEGKRGVEARLSSSEQFDDALKKALQAFQRKHNIEPTGNFGPKTCRALFPKLETAKNKNTESASKDVRSASSSTVKKSQTSPITKFNLKQENIETFKVDLIKLTLFSEMDLSNPGKTLSPHPCWTSQQEKVILRYRSFLNQGKAPPADLSKRVKTGAGITIGIGLDSGQHTRADLEKFLTKAGIPISPQWNTFLNAAGKRGDAAYSYWHKNKNQLATLSISPKEQEKLFKVTYESIQNTAERCYEKWCAVRRPEGVQVPWTKLPDHTKAVLVDLTYRGDNTRKTRAILLPHLTEGHYLSFYKEFLNQHFWKNDRKVPTERFKRRAEFALAHMSK